ncbi:hypothetical protein C2G38_2185313 [Gigaspora rosea]|uniref:NADH:ubiquinone oxidoreductase 30kDa subunit domain-containing protein n=1 Tax=Gigaspora rosea TaxID=44941 RepID=A0A397VA63_9GLOM|nr:hypothetical protein C2G38_2185313 [Gigaspora rosea]
MPSFINVIRSFSGSRLLLKFQKPHFSTEVVPFLRGFAFRQEFNPSPIVSPFARHSHKFFHQTTIVQDSSNNTIPKKISNNESLHEYGKHLLSMLPKFIQLYSVYKDELSLYVAPNAIIPVMTFLRDHTGSQFKQVQDICGVDYPSRPNRFEIVYNMLSIHYNARIRVKTYANEISPVPSIVSLFNGANWFEREVYDMYGVIFTDHPDLRRILTDYGFEGHPMRKDFPLTGYVEIRYDEERKRVVAEPLEMTQSFRNFEGAASPWEQTGPGNDERPDSYKFENLLPKPKSSEKK